MKEFSFKQFIYIILILIFIYVGFETLLRWTLPKLFGFVVELNELANIKNIENYNEYYSSNYKKYLNPIIGFNIYNPDKKNISDFTKLELQIYGNSMYLIDNSLILSNIDLFNKNYILNNIPFFIETTEDSIN